jgi:hypothetical protein
VHHTTEHAHEMHVRLPTMPGFEWRHVVHS